MFKTPVKHIKLFFVLTVVVFTNKALAVELVETFKSVRALGMGNAYSAIVDDSDALFYNPAGLARVSGYYWTIMDPYFGLNGQEALETVNSLQGADPQNQLASLYGKKLWAGGSGKTAIRVPGLAFAGYTGGEGKFALDNPAYPNLSLRFINDTGFAFGAGFSAGFIQMGIAARRILRIGGDVPLGPGTLGAFDANTLSSNVGNKGTGYGLDFGMNLTIPTPVAPTFSFVWKNMGYTAFTADTAGLDAPPLIRDEMILGFGLDIDAGLVAVRPAIDFKYANRYDLLLGMKTHLGLEFELPLVTVRGGFNQGYYTYGATLDMAFFKLDLASYGVELGEYPGQKEDRRYALQFSMELGFDFGFDLFGDGSGRKDSKTRRRLKLRR